MASHKFHACNNLLCNVLWICIEQTAKTVNCSNYSYFVYLSSVFYIFFVITFCGKTKLRIKDKHMKIKPRIDTYIQTLDNVHNSQAHGLNRRHGKVVFLLKLDGKCKFVITIPAHVISRASSLNSVMSLVHSAAVTGRVDVPDAAVTELCDEFSTQCSRDWAGGCTRRNSHSTLWWV